MFWRGSNGTCGGPPATAPGWPARPELGDGGAGQRPFAAGQPGGVVDVFWKGSADGTCGTSGTGVVRWSSSADWAVRSADRHGWTAEPRITAEAEVAYLGHHPGPVLYTCLDDLSVSERTRTLMASSRPGFPMPCGESSPRRCERQAAQHGRQAVRPVRPGRGVRGGRHPDHVHHLPRPGQPDRGDLRGSLGWLAGAAVSYVISRWAWERKGGPTCSRRPCRSSRYPSAPASS